jgi:asparagine synthase (glutamine-hydrolysing)
MKKAQEKVKVILDGQGGDELFAGYIPYFGLHIEDLIKSGNPLNWSKALHLSLEVKRHWGSQWLKPALRNIIGPAGQTIIRELKKNSTPATAVQKLLHTSLLEQCSGREITRVRPKRFTSLLENTLYWHLVEQSIPGLLHYEDRNSMAFSIEARVPLLDYRIVEYSLGLDPSYKIKGSWSKWVLRQCADRILPRKVTWRRSKMGYPTPFFRWLREDADREQVKELLFSRTFTERELVNSEALKTLWEQHQSGAQDHSWLLYRCITLELWFRHFIDAFKPVPAPSKAGAHG